MKVVLSILENWTRSYIVEIPDDTPQDKWDEVATAAYSKWTSTGARYTDNTVTSYGEPEYLDDGPSSSFFVTEVYDD